jgi:hypothetical protein
MFALIARTQSMLQEQETQSLCVVHIVDKGLIGKRSSNVKDMKTK